MTNDEKFRLVLWLNFKKIHPEFISPHFVAKLPHVVPRQHILPSILLMNICSVDLHFHWYCIRNRRHTAHVCGTLNSLKRIECRGIQVVLEWYKYQIVESAETCSRSRLVTLFMIKKAVFLCGCTVWWNWPAQYKCIIEVRCFSAWVRLLKNNFLLIYFLTYFLIYLLHGSESFLRS